MAQQDYVIADQTGVSFLDDINLNLAAIVSNNSGATEPTTKHAYMWWADTTSGILKQRNAGNTVWINKGLLSTVFDQGVATTDSPTFAGINIAGPLTSAAGDFNLIANTALSDAAATLTAAQLFGGEFTITPTVARIQTLDTAANIISALSGSVTGSHFTFTVVNLAAFDVTIATAAGVTLVGNMVVNDGPAMFRVRRLTSSTVSVTRLGNVQYPGIELQSSVATTSGTSLDFSGIPAGVKRITVGLDEVSFNANASLVLRLGDSGGVEASGYNVTMTVLASSFNATAPITTGFELKDSGVSTHEFSGNAVFSLMDASTNTWSGVVSCRINSTAVFLTVGTKSLSSELTTVQLVSGSGSANFDNGKASISLEF